MFKYKLLSVVTQLTKVRYTISIRQINRKYTSKVYLKDTSRMLKVYFHYTSCYLKDTFSIFQIYFKYASRILQPVELQKKNYTSSLSYFDKRTTFEVHFAKLNQYF